MADTVGHVLFGRRAIYTDTEVITDTNVTQVLSKALLEHNTNRIEMDYLYDYYRGKQPILNRIKEVRPEICNTVVENRANEIVSFKVGYLMGEPIQYVNASKDTTEQKTDEIGQLNEYMLACNKASCDEDLAEWYFTVGVGYRMILPSVSPDADSPFELYTLDPRNTFIIRSNSLGNKPVMGVKYVMRTDGSIVYSCYTNNKYFEISSSGADMYKLEKSENHFFGGIPIFEYKDNSARLGAFEIVLTLLDAINEVSSDRVDGLDQFIQALMMFKGVDIDDEDYRSLKEEGAIRVPPDGDIKYLVAELNQTQTQTLVDDLYEKVLTICGMPNRNGGSSTSDTGKAVILRDGWSAAESRARWSENKFKEAEREFLKMALNMMNSKKFTSLAVKDIRIQFTRRNFENIQEKSQVLTTMLTNDKIHPRLAFEYSGMFTDPERAYAISVEYMNEQQKKAEEELAEFVNNSENSENSVNKETEEE